MHTEKVQVKKAKNQHDREKGIEARKKKKTARGN